MPFIDFKTNVSVSKESSDALKARFGSAMADLGKSESWLMVNIEGDKALYFGGSDEPAAIAEVALFGRANAGQYDKMTADMTDIISELLPVSPGRIYVKYEEVDHWGFNGGNF